MKAWIFVCLACFVARSCRAQGGTSGSTGTAVSLTEKTVTLHCIKNEMTNVLEMTLKVGLSANPQGALIALDRTQYLQTVFNISEVACAHTYDSTNKIYTVNSNVDLTGSNANDLNVCGRTNGFDTAVYYEWYFLYASTPATTTQPLWIGGPDAVFKAVCRMDSLTSNRLYANLTVQSPNLNQDATIANLDVTFVVQKKTENAFNDATSVNAGDIIRLKAEYNRGNSFVENFNYGSIYLFNAMVSAFSGFSPGYTLVGSNGCAKTTGTVADPTAPTFPFTGFKGSNQGPRNIHVTSEFRAWKDVNSNNLYFRVYFGRCLELSTIKCNDFCFFNSGLNEAAGRKRRQDDGEESAVVTIVINVGDGEDVSRTAERSSDTNTIIIVGAVVGAVILVTLCLLICMVAMMRRRKMEKKPAKTNLPEIIPQYGNKY